LQKKPISGIEKFGSAYCKQGGSLLMDDFLDWKTPMNQRHQSHFDCFSVYVELDGLLLNSTSGERGKVEVLFYYAVIYAVTKKGRLWYLHDVAVTGSARCGAIIVLIVAIFEPLQGLIFGKGMRRWNRHIGCDTVIHPIVGSVHARRGTAEQSVHEKYETANRSDSQNSVSENVHGL
jgi:hypothetical protein